MTSVVTSADGTRIAYDRFGAGPPLVLVVGSFNSRRSHRRLAEALAPFFTVTNYDRRGRGESGDTLPYAVEREMEDLAAILAEIDGGARVFGHSSGAVLSLKAAIHGCPITGLAMYEPPFFIDGSRTRPGLDLPDRISALIAAGRVSDGIDLFYSECLDMPPALVAQIRKAPLRSRVEAVAHTLPYDAAVVGDLSIPFKSLRTLDVPALHLTADSPGLLAGAHATTQALPLGRHIVLAGQTHDVVPSVVAPVLVDFFLGAEGGAG